MKLTNVCDPSISPIEINSFRISRYQTRLVRELGLVFLLGVRRADSSPFERSGNHTMVCVFFPKEAM